MSYKKIIGLLLFVFTSIICGIMIYDVNRRIPAPKKYIYTHSNPCKIDGVKFVPLETVVYSYDELKEEYPDFKPMIVKDMPKEARYVVYKIRVMNASPDIKSFYPVYFEAADCKTGWSNGLEPRFSFNVKTVLKGYETIDLELIAFNIKGDFSDDLAIAMSYYPDYRIMKFKD